MHQVFKSCLYKNKNLSIPLLIPKNDQIGDATKYTTEASNESAHWYAIIPTAASTVD